MLEVAVHLAVDLCRQRHPGIALVGEIANKGAKGLLGTGLEVADRLQQIVVLLGDLRHGVSALVGEVGEVVIVLLRVEAHRGPERISCVHYAGGELLADVIEALGRSLGLQLEDLVKVLNPVLDELEPLEVNLLGLVNLPLEVLVKVGHTAVDLCEAVLERKRRGDGGHFFLAQKRTINNYETEGRRRAFGPDHAPAAWPVVLGVSLPSKGLA
eukprot:XP_001707448.1 Hypothetical protein GL50803_15907 [Giardia lamblia ATCC 50803]